MKCRACPDGWCYLEPLPVPAPPPRYCICRDCGARYRIVTHRDRSRQCLPEVIVALDVPSVDEAQRLADRIGARWYKVGLELIYAHDGIAFARHLMATGRCVFLDAKLADIPTTVERATHRICAEIEPHILSVHRNVGSALAGCSGHTIIAHVPYFTSDTDAPLVTTSAPAIVCRASQAAHYRARGLTVIVPGIRPAGSPRDDHTDAPAACSDADYIVVGRPVTRADDPAAALARIAGR